MISKTQYREIQKEIDSALADIAKKYNLSKPVADLRMARDGSFVRLMKTDMSYQTASKSAENADNVKEFGKDVDPILAKHLKILGIKSLVNARGEKIVAYKASRYKYPFSYEGPRGGRWKATAVEITRLFA